MNLCKCTFDELPSAMQMHVLYIQKIPVSEYQLAIWSEKDTFYYNDLKESEVEQFVTLIERKKIAEKVAEEYFPIIEKAMDKRSIPLSGLLLKAM